jgi:UDP-glucose 4-epimerase
LIPLVLRAVQTGEPVTIFGDDYPTPDGTCIRDYIHVSDLAEAHIVAVEYLLKGGRSDSFNLGTGRGHSVKEVLSAVERVSGRIPPHLMGLRREGDPPNLVADAGKVQRELGWRATRISLDGIVRDALSSQSSSVSI